MTVEGIDRVTIHLKLLHFGAVELCELCNVTRANIVLETVDSNDLYAWKLFEKVEEVGKLLLFVAFCFSCGCGCGCGCCATVAAACTSGGHGPPCCEELLRNREITYGFIHKEHELTVDQSEMTDRRKITSAQKIENG